MNGGWVHLALDLYFFENVCVVCLYVCLFSNLFINVASAAGVGPRANNSYRAGNET